MIWYGLDNSYNGHHRDMSYYNPASSIIFNSSLPGPRWRWRYIRIRGRFECTFFKILLNFKMFYLNSWSLPYISMMVWCWIIDMIIKYVSSISILYNHVSSMSSPNWVYYMGSIKAYRTLHDRTNYDLAHSQHVSVVMQTVCILLFCCVVLWCITCGFYPYSLGFVFTGTGTIVRLAHCRRSDPSEYQFTFLYFSICIAHVIVWE